MSDNLLYFILMRTSVGFRLPDGQLVEIKIRVDDPNIVPARVDGQSLQFFLII